ncbi:DNA-dependent protein kinase catalytic subunit-like [Homarus americanus]|uniref:DNA-dependent protein kinase catalytic subunit-like n=1 Tax=Homarus americanus TaxID=6706 RepID=UPI001C48E648|nr:DNA-dependent protein kinase catalytic subunit-like [Homarus americanus]
MAGGRRGEVEQLLDKLHDCFTPDGQRDTETSRNVVVDVAEYLSQNLSPVQYDLSLSHVLGEKGIIVFGRKVSKDQAFVETKKSTLNVIKILIEKDVKKIVKYVDDIRKYTMFLYYVDNSTTVRAVALEVFCVLLEKCGSHINVADINVDQFIERLFLSIRSPKGSTVMHHQLRTLGMLTNTYPENLRHQASFILKIFKEQLAKHTGTKPDLIALAGVLRGLTLYLYHFPEGLDDDPQLFEHLYKHIHKVLNPDLNLPRRDAQRAALELVCAHGDKFSAQMYEKYDTLFPWLIKWCGAKNRDDHKAALPTMDTFICVIANMLELQAGGGDKKGVQVFKYFLQQYNLLLEKSDSTSQVGLAVKGYASLSAACRLFLSPVEVHTMYTQVLTASHYYFYQSTDMPENKLNSLPNYVESLAIIINNMSLVNMGIMESVQQLSLALVEKFPLISMFRRFLAYRALFKLFHAVYSKAEYFQDFLHTFVYNSIVVTCSHAPEMESSPGEEGVTWRSNSPEGDGKWKGLKNEVTSYKSFLPIWNAFMKPEKVVDIKVKGIPATVMTEISSKLYSEFISCTLEITKKLDLTTFKQGEPVKDEAETGEESVATSDPVSGLKAKTPKDFQVYMNVITLMEEVLPLQSENHLEPHVSHLCWFFVRCSSLQPLVSAHYTAITTVLSCTQRTYYFKKHEDPEVGTVIHLIKSYIRELLQRCRQFRDQLLASCLTLILKLPLCIVIDIFPQLVSPLQMALQLGISYLPLAEVCVSALQVWIRQLPHDTLHQNLPLVLPLLLPYLRSQETGGEAEVQARVITVKMAFAYQRRKVDQKKMLDGKQMDETAMRKVQLSILRLIGSLDPKLSMCVIPQDPDTLAAAAVRWDTLKHIKFATPFEQVKIDIFLDDILPHVVDLAINSSDRQTKVAASELLHSVIILMIGTGAQQHPDLQAKYPMAPLYHHVFEAMLQLACDPDQVTRQLFLTLSYQTIHWFTNNENSENVDTNVLLEAIMEGIVTANNPALRDVSARCLAEFVKWSRKQCRRKDTVSSNLKSILKRIFSFCRHPSAFKRLGGSLAWNSIYSEVREDEKAVDIWILELLTYLVSALDLAQADDPALGTHEQTQAAIYHVERIIRVKKEVFWKKSAHRRVPSDLGDGTLDDLLLWLLKQCGRPKSIVRHACMELLVSLSPHAKGCKSVSNFVEKHIGKDNMETIVDILEGGEEACQGIKYHSTPTSYSQTQVTVKDVNNYCEALLAALDGYSWLIGRKILPAAQLLGGDQVHLFTAATYFIEHMATVTISDYLQNNQTITRDEIIMITPYESEGATKLKCTVVVRLMDFLTVVLQDGPSCAHFLDENSLWSSSLFKLLIQCVLDPASIGFDIKDTEVTKHLPSRLEDMLKVMHEKVSQDVAQAFVQYLEKQLQLTKYNVEKLLPSSFSTTVTIPLGSQHVIEGVEILQKSGWLTDCSTVKKTVASDLAKWVCDSLFVERDFTLEVVSPNPSHLQFLNAVMHLSVTLDSQVLQQLLRGVTDGETVTGLNGQHTEKGSHILDILGPNLMPHLLVTCDLTLVRCVQLIKDGRFLPAMGFTAALLNSMIRSQELRKRHSVKVVQAFLYHWQTLSAEAGKTSIHQESVLGVLSSLFLVDLKSTIKTHCSNPGSDIEVYYKNILSDAKVELQLKIKAMKLLPFFFTMSPAVAKCMGEALELLSLNHFPLQSTEFLSGGARDREYHLALSEMLTALELSMSPVLLQFLVRLFCREDKHRYEEDLNESLEKFMKRQSETQQLESLRLVYKMFSDQTCTKQLIRHNIMEKVLSPLLQHSGLTSLTLFLVEVSSQVMAGVSLPVKGRSEEQQKVLITKTGSFMILQIMYCTLPREKVFAPGSEVNSAYRPNDQSGKELTKEVFRHASKIAKGDLRHDKTHEELRRLCACAAYNALIAVLACVQNDLRFYTSFLFSANSVKGEAIWECLIDCNKPHEFDMEVNFNPGNKRRFVAVRSKLREDAKREGGVAGGTVQYIASHYLSDSSLREDISQFDFNNSVVLAMSQTEQLKAKATNMDGDSSKLMSLHLDQSDYNGHEVMANLTAVIHHMVDTEIMVLHKGDSTPSVSDVPQLITLIQQKIESAETPRNVKLFLLRLMMNTSKVFAPYAAHFVNPILTCLVDGTLGNKINYFLCDVMVMLMGWGQKAVPQHSVLGRNMVARAMSFLCSNTPHNRADVFKYNLDVVRSVMECWKEVLTVPYPIIYSLLGVKDGANREVEAGLQLLGIVLAIGVAPYNVDSQVEKARCENLLVKLLGSRFASAYGTASEVLGLVFKFMDTQENGSDDVTLEDNVVQKVLEINHQMPGQAITCIYNIHKHYPPIVRRFINRLLNLLPKLYGIHRTRILECLVSHSLEMEDVFSHLKEKNLLETLARKESSTQLVSLQLVNTVMPRLTPPQVLYFMPGIVAFASHPSPKCRETMYDVLFWMYDNYSDHQSEEGRQIESEARSILLQAVKEEDAALKQSVLNFWLQGSKNLTLPQCILHILRNMYSPDSEDSFLQIAIYILLEATRHSADYQRDIFNQPLTLCKFREMKVSTEWRARHASMIPLFAETQGSTDSSLNSLLSLTQGSDFIDADITGLGGVQATQANVFSATQQKGGAFNWVTGSTFDTTIADMEYEATHAPTQGPTSGLLFNARSSRKPIMLRYKRQGVGNTPMQPPDETDGADSESSFQSKLLRRRFVRNQDREKQTIYFAKMEERRRKLRDKLEHERRSRREAQVTMYRSYRIGELPDIQIPHRALIAPLQALAQRDGKVARLLLEVLTQGVIDNMETLMSRGEEDLWHQQLNDLLNGVLANSYMCNPEMMRTVLHLMINNDISVNPEILAAACLGSRLEALGILVLERKVLVSKRGEARVQPPAIKKIRADPSTQSPDATLWLSMAELYKSLDMWDVVRGIVQSKLGSIKKETRAALQAEATNNHVEAFVHYRTALATTDWEEEPEPAEVRVWEEWYTSCAAMLGQWKEVETFLEDRFLKEDGQVKLDRVWLLPRPAAAILPALLHSKLMSILDGAESDNNICDFINNAMGEPRYRALLEGELPLQLAVLSTNQEKFAQAQSYFTTATSTTLLTLAQYTLLTPKPLVTTLRNVQLLTELGDFFDTIKYAENDNYPTKVKQTVINWKKQEANLADTSLLIQCLSSYRELYLHFLEKRLKEDSQQDVPQVITATKISINMSIIKAALKNNNYHLAARYLKKLKALSNDNCSRAQFHFLMAETNILRGRGKPSCRLQYLVETWGNNLGKVSVMPELEQNTGIEVRYLKLESTLCFEICDSIQDMGNEWQHENKYMQILASKFLNANGKESWYNELLKCSYIGLKKAVKCAEDSLLKFVDGVEETQDPGKDIHMALVKYCEDCLENWRNNIDAPEYNKTLIIAVLRAMSLGSRDAHFHFPRLINLMEEDPSLVSLFIKGCETVPVWMFLLWISHILIYVDKSPGPALQPVIEKLAAEYPQAVHYPFGISMKSYDFTSDIGKSAKVMCQKVQTLLNKNSLLQQFVTAVSLMVVPAIACKDAICDLIMKKDKKDIEHGLEKVISELLKVSSRLTKGSPNEKGEAYIKQDRIRMEVSAALDKMFGENRKKVKTMSVQGIQKALFNIKQKMELNSDDFKKMPKQLKAYSPWLANFQASKHSDMIELPGQYSGMSKPLPEYHVKISSFDENLMLMTSLRVPMRVVIRGDDEKDHKFLVKWGEDLRTDQRMEQMFILMNSLYSTSVCAHTTSRPFLDTYQVVPLSLEVGLLQWVESSQPLKEFMSVSYKDNEKNCYKEARGIYEKASHWVVTKKGKKKDVVKTYENVVNKIPWDLLRRGLIKLSSNSEGFFALRSAFAVSYATLCISHWLLGIGDRHCGNSLVSLKTGHVVGIDFGHHFETAVQFLPYPELMPFRLTPQIANVFQPVGHIGMLREVMVAALGALRESRHVLTSVLEAFVKEPTEDWLDFVRRQEGDVEDSKVEIFSKDRIRCLKDKLSGINPAYVTLWAVSQGKHFKRDPSMMPFLQEVVLGNRGEHIRADIGKDGLSTHQQVDVLLEQASDPNILGRTWIGWDPFM